MSSDHQDTSGFQPPNTVEEFHRQPPSSTTGDNLPDSTTLRLPHTASPLTPSIETNESESPISASLGGAIFTTPSTSFDATDSSDNQDPPTITTTPPKVSEPPTRNSLLRRSHFHQQLPHRKNKTPPPGVSSSPPKSRTSPPGSSTTRKHILESKLRKMGDKVCEIKERFCDVIRQSQEHAENDNPPQAMVENPHNGCFRLELSCSCGKRKGICRDVSFFLNIVLMLCFFFMIGISYSFLLVLSKIFP
ncbi:unnamed protein product [Lactuca saligna]|uniref:Uncharacterized protein n=1 Tax=Lactuca saligna TaxID=75948 RepID=A0AA35YMW2_LACSI|nr:unnamed protein product [Lactuca saligna]